VITILYFLAWFLAAIPTLEGTANTIANSVAATSMAAAAGTMISCVLRSAGTFIGIQVDQVLGEQEIVIKQFEGPAPKPVGCRCHHTGDGRIMPIADVEAD